MLDYIKHLSGIDDECCDHFSRTNGVSSPKFPAQKITENPLLPTIVPKLPPPEPVKSGRIGGKIKRKASSSIDDEMNNDEDSGSRKNGTFVVPAAPKSTTSFESKPSLFGSNAKLPDSSKPIPMFNFPTMDSKTTSTNIFTSPSSLTDEKDKNVTKEKTYSIFNSGTLSDISKKPEDSDNDKSNTKPSYPSLFGSTDNTKPMFSFMSAPVSQEKDGKTQTKSTLPTFCFQPNTTVSEKKNEEENKGEEENDEEEEQQEKYDPLQADKDALYNVKCSLHQLIDKQYVKKGVAFINVKELDGKKVIIVRATNAIGSILINTHINENLKVAKLEGTKVRLSFPNSNGSEMETWIARVPGENDVKELLENLKF